MENGDQKVERLLKEFKPRAVRDLKIPAMARHSWTRRLAAAAVVICFAGGGVWELHRHRARNGRTSVKLQSFVATRIALSDEKDFDVFLDEESRNALPDFRGERSALRSLAKE